MKTETLYRKARAHGVPASAALAAARRYIAGPLTDYRAKLDAWNAEPDKRRYAPGGIANRPTMPEFYREPRGLALREAEKPRWLDHDGWFTDDMQDNTFRPRVWLLPHGRFLAGYDSSAWDTMQLDRAVYDDEREAWRAADGMAERDAETERDYSERWQAARDVQDARDEKREAMRSAHGEARGLVAVLRDLPQTAASRATICGMIRECRERMAEALQGMADDAEKLAAFAADGVEV